MKPGIAHPAEDGKLPNLFTGQGLRCKRMIGIFVHVQDLSAHTTDGPT